MPIHHEIRTNRKQKTRKVKLTPLKAIKFNCIECMGFQDKFVFDCMDKLCPCIRSEPEKPRPRTSSIYV